MAGYLSASRPAGSGVPLTAVLIRMRRSAERNRFRGPARIWALAAAALTLALAAGTCLLAAVSYRHPAARIDVVAAVLFGWSVGPVAGAALSPGSGVNLDHLRLLPLPDRRLAHGLLGAALADPAWLWCLPPFAALPLLGWYANPSGSAMAVAVGLVAMILQWVAVVTTATIVSGTLELGARRGRDLGAVLIALLVALLSSASAILPLLESTLVHRDSPALTWLVRLLPSGWGAVAAGAAGRRDWPLAMLALAGLAMLTTGLLRSWPRLVGRRLRAGRAAPSGFASTRQRARRILPATPVGAVIAREVRAYGRDTIRLVSLLVALVVGVIVGVVPLLSGGSPALLPWVGAMVLVLAGGCASNLYGDDGPALWLTLVTPGAIEADVTGRQRAWLVVVGSTTATLTVALTAASGVGWTWPWVLGLLPALLGGSTAIVVLSVYWLLPPAADGGPSPIRQLKIHLMVFAVALTAAPPLAVLVAGDALSSTLLTWLAVPAGAATGIGAVWAGRRLSVARLSRRGPELLAAARPGA